LVPSWAEDPKIGYSTINARAETVATKPAFREAFRKRHCLVPTDGFYEWAKVPDGKQPYRITMKDGVPFAMAGLWEWWRRGEQRIESFTIIVTAANKLCRSIHDRVPVILHPDTWETWLTTKDAETASALLQPYPASLMTMYPVRKRVGNVKNDDPQLVLPV
jgi:putative SOS response-associated peptidase YedK